MAEPLSRKRQMRIRDRTDAESIISKSNSTCAPTIDRVDKTAMRPMMQEAFGLSRSISNVLPSRAHTIALLVSELITVVRIIHVTNVPRCVE